jgi:hypothetical protein
MEPGETAGLPLTRAVIAELSPESIAPAEAPELKPPLTGKIYKKRMVGRFRASRDCPRMTVKMFVPPKKALII